ncbi:glycoside hydrolase family 43 protein [Amanita thiersii Skay4041]|uniref:Glycoside hydrolase family 43 protein n=1 Tax=Amanita thiersii Skay4041 TaxID=703135 RepID=A0A2A9NGH4_9AGAR|nr:glycoside hydrolase family 43 protein [Amanita thiersii Skay4041]
MAFINMLRVVLAAWSLFICIGHPTILRVGSDYFIATSTFEYFPGHPIYHSKNLVDWALIGHTLSRPSQLSLFGTPSDAGLWAPTLRYHKGTFYLTSTTRYVYTWNQLDRGYRFVAELRLFPRPFYVTTKDIFSNDWSDPIYLDALGYDVDLFWDVNGDVYCTWSGINDSVDQIYSIWQNKIDIVTGNSLTPAKEIFQGTLPHNFSARPEGPHIYLVNSTYYLLIAEGGTGVHHQATIQRGPSASGPWENNPNNPILFNGADLSLPVQDTGHADMVEGLEGRWWGVALGVRPQNQNFSHLQLGRETFLFPITWKDDWPVFNGGKPILEHLPGVLEDRLHVHPYENMFKLDSLDASFYFIRTPYKSFYSLTERPAYLRLHGNSYAPGDRDNAALILRKQTSYAEWFETKLDFHPRDNLTEAGISIFYGDLLHNEIAITGDANATGKRFVVFRTAVTARQVGPWTLTTNNSTIKTTKRFALNGSGPVKLAIKGDSTSYTLAYAEDGQAGLSVAGIIDSSAMSIAPSGGFFFKGASFGMYSTGNGKPSLVPADFEYWKQIPM